MWVFEIIACFLVVLKAGSSRNTGVIQVHSDKQFCSDGGDMSYTTAENLSLVISSDSNIIVCPLKLNVSAVVEIRDVFNITIRGKVNETSEINCSGNSGFRFVNAYNVALCSLTLKGCSVLEPQEKSASVFFLNCAEITVFQLSIEGSHDTGMLLQNTTGAVDIHSCTFESNGQHVSISLQHVSDPSTYNISYCNFSRASQESEFGGGLEVIVNRSQHVDVHILAAHFKENNASIGGGGMSVRYFNSLNSTIEVVDSMFLTNGASEGGGLYVEIFSSMETALKMLFTGCLFYSNHATTLGGGTRISSTKMNGDHVVITFVNGTWHENVAFYGSAFCAVPDTKNILTLRGFLPRLKFDNALFENNHVIKHFFPEDTRHTRHTRQYVEGIGALYSIEFELNFTGSLNVANNNGTAFRLEYCAMFIARNSRVVFSGNEGAYGGAMYVLSGRIIAGSHAEIEFSNNTAERTGGAIHYYTCSSLWTNFSDSCCISKENNGTGIIFTFNNNTSVKNGIDSIRILSTAPCLRSINISGEDFNDSMVFANVGKFSFQPNDDMQRHINTAVKSFDLCNITEEVTKVIPGIPKNILITSMNDHNQENKGIYAVRMKSVTTIKPFPYAIVNNSNLTFYGNTMEKGVVLISTKSTRRITLSFKIKLEDCPPGFMMRGNSCVCIFKGTQLYHEIYCNWSEVKAYRTPGIWVNHTLNEDDLESGYCPAGYCSDDFSLEILDDNPNIFNICREGREKRLCGACINNYSVYYHSRYYHCGKTDLCYLGWLFYILTEIVPVTVLFIIIIYSDKSLSSGLANGYVFYAQVLLTLRIGGEDYFKLPGLLHIAQGYISLFYGIFNLDFFVHENLAFCLWKGATPLSIMVMDYLTQAYALALVFALVVLIKYSHRLHSFIESVGVTFPSISRSTIHGITAFLILTYSQNVSVSIALLRPGYIFINNSETYQAVIHYMGVYEFGDHNHIPYALIATTSLTFFVALPMLLLLIYPLHYKILLLLHLSESNSIKKLINPLEKLKPVFDSFQSTFKDNFRFFSGLLFLYRFIISLTFTVNTPVTYYAFMEAELVVILIIQAACQPHKERIHNVVDTLLLGNLILINTFSIFHLYYKDYPHYMKPYDFILSCIQLILVYMPLVVALALACRKLFNFLKDWIRKMHNSDTCEVDADGLLELECIRDMDHQPGSFESSSSYKLHSVLNSITDI